jgi:hypothetical protein
MRLKANSALVAAKPRTMELINKVRILRVLEDTAA